MPIQVASMLTHPFNILLEHQKTFIESKFVDRLLNKQPQPYQVDDDSLRKLTMGVQFPISLSEQPQQQNP